MPEILSSDALGNWLRGKPPGFIAALASRVALRTLPLSLVRFPQTMAPDRAIDASLRMLRGNAITRAALKSPTPGNALRALGNARSDLRNFSWEEDESNAVMLAIVASISAIDGGISEHHVGDQLLGPGLDLEYMAGAIEADYHWSEQSGFDQGRLLARPLWPTPRPRWFEEALSQTYWIWLDEPDRWRVWNTWFDWRLEGQPNEWGVTPLSDSKISARLIDAGDEFWYNGEHRAESIAKAIVGWAGQFKVDHEITGQFEWIKVPYATSQTGVLNPDAIGSRVQPVGAGASLVGDIFTMMEKIPPAWATAIAVRASLRCLPLQIRELPGRQLVTVPPRISWDVFPSAALTYGTVLHREKDLPGTAFPDVALLSRGREVGPDRDVDTFGLIRFLFETGDDGMTGPEAFDACDRTVSGAVSGIEQFLADDRQGPIPLATKSRIGKKRIQSFLSERLSSVPGDLWAMISRDMAELSAGLPLARLLSRPLWHRQSPDWATRIWLEVRRSLGASQQGFEVWTKWYDLRLRGLSSSFDVPSAEADVRLLIQVFGQPEEWWERPARQINADVTRWLADFQRINPQWDLFDPANGDDASDALENLKLEPEAQSGSGLTFTERADGRLEVNEAAGSETLLTTPEACDFHAELKETLDEAAKRCAGHNQATSLAPILLQVSGLMGDHPSQLRIGRFMQRAERCLKLANAMAQDLYEGEPLARLPVATREIATLLDALPIAYWAMVHFDPVLDAHLRNLKDHDLEAEPSLSTAMASEIMASAVSDGVLTPESAQIVAEMGEGLDDGGERDQRRDRRFGETMRNVSRAILSKLWHNRSKIAKGLKSARVEAWAGGTALYGFAKFLVSHVDWVHATLARSPGMLHLADELIAACKLLPF